MSAVPTIETHIAELFTDALADEPTRVVYGYAEAKELVAIFTAEFDRRFRLLGPQEVPLDEDFQIEVVIEAITPSGRDMKAAADRCWEIFELIDAAIRGDHHLDEVSWDARFAKGSREFFQTDKSQGCRIRTTLAGTARI
jgi:hypothetical protein